MTISAILAAIVLYALIKIGWPTDESDELCHLCKGSREFKDGSCPRCVFLATEIE